MKKLLAVLMVLILGIAVMLPATATQVANGEKHDYMVAFNGEINRGLIKAFGVSDDAFVTDFQYRPVTVVSLTEAQAKGLSNHPQIQYIEKDAEVTLLSQETPWGITRVQAPQVWNEGPRGAGVKVAILDTGVHAAHPDLNVHGGWSVFGDNPLVDVQGHGTHVAGTVAALDNGIGVIGVAPEALIYAVKVLDDNGSGTLAGIAQGIDWARVNKMHVINMSLGGSSGSTTLEKAVNDAWNDNINVIAAAGNSGRGWFGWTTVGFPARYPNAMAVAATDQNNVRASFSSVGPEVEISAPGVGVLSTIPTNGYASYNGTSMASPHVAGVAALLKSANMNYTASQIRNAMNSTALYLGTWNDYGHGLVRAHNALQSLQ